MPAVVTLRPKTAPSDEPFPEGLNLATLTAARIAENKNTGTPSVDLVFEAPPYRMVDHLYVTPANEKRCNIFAKRLLGSDYDPEAEELDVDFEKAVGEQYVIDVVHEPYEDKEGKSRTAQKLQYAGVWPLDHDDKKVKEFLATQTGAPKAGANGTAPKKLSTSTAKPTKPAGKDKPKFDDV